MTACGGEEKIPESSPPPSDPIGSSNETALCAKARRAAADPEGLRPPDMALVLAAQSHG